VLTLKEIPMYVKV